MVELCFVANEEPRAIRSHARRTVHRQARLQRVSEYRKQTASGDDHPQDKVTKLAGTDPDSPVALGNPSSYLDSLRRDPFQSLALPLGDVEQMLIDYYVKVFVPNPTPQCTVIIPAEIYVYQVMTQWVPFAFADQCLLNGLLLHGCRRIVALEGNPHADYYGRLALKYKVACIQSLRALVSNRATAPSDTLIAGALFLALDEIQEQNVKEATSHVRAVDLMVELRGGQAFLGLQGFLARVISLCRFHVGTGQN